MAQARTSTADGRQVRSSTRHYRSVDTLPSEATVGDEPMVSSGSPAYPLNPNMNLTFPAPGRGTLADGLSELNPRVHFPEHGAFQRSMMQSTVAVGQPVPTSDSTIRSSSVRIAEPVVLQKEISSTEMASGRPPFVILPDTFSPLVHQINSNEHCHPSTMTEYGRTHQNHLTAYSCFGMSACQSELDAHGGRAGWSSMPQQFPWCLGQNQAMGNRTFLDVPPMGLESSSSGRRCSTFSTSSAPPRLGLREFSYAAEPIEWAGSPQNGKFLNVLNAYELPATAPGSPLPMDTTHEFSTGDFRCQKCNVTFNGKYAKGNLARHCRVKHGQGREYGCRICSKSYKRQDARVKHYRKHHPELVSKASSPQH